MKTLTTLLLAIVIAFPSFSQKRNVDVGNFSELSLGIAANVYLKQGSSNEVIIECDDDRFEDIEFKMSGDRLVIKNENDWGWNRGWRKSEVTIYVTMKDIEELSVSGSGMIESKGQLKTNDLELSVSGSGDMELQLASDEIEMSISGSGTIRLEGDAEAAQARISGSGKVKAEDMTVKVFEARISGSGSCYITATDEVQARISGSGSVYYSGDPKKVISDSSGSGKVRKM